MGKRGDGKAMENVSYVRDENGPEAPLTAANLSLKITSTQLDQEFYLGPTQTKKKKTKPGKLLKIQPVTWSVGLRTQRKRRKRPSVGKTSQAVKGQGNGLPINNFQGETPGWKEKEKGKKLLFQGMQFTVNTISQAYHVGHVQMNTQ